MPIIHTPRGRLFACTFLAVAFVLTACSSTDGETPHNDTSRPPSQPTVGTTLAAAFPTTPATAEPTAVQGTPQLTVTPTEELSQSVDAAWSTYLALGDSAVTGKGLPSPATQGYVALFANHLEAAGVGSGAIEVLNLAQNGETTSSVLQNGQLDAAIQQLRSRNGNTDPGDDIGVVTLHIGGNDGVALIEDCPDGLTSECLFAIPAKVETMTANLDAIVGRLREAAGTDTILILGTYYNGLSHPDCELHQLAELAVTVLDGAPLFLPNGLNDIIRSTAAKHGAMVAEMGFLEPAQLLPDCHHANAVGHRVIADAFIAAFEQ